MWNVPYLREQLLIHQLLNHTQFCFLLLQEVSYLLYLCRCSLSFQLLIFLRVSCKRFTLSLNLPIVLHYQAWVNLVSQCILITLSTSRSCLILSSTSSRRLPVSSVISYPAAMILSHARHFSSLILLSVLPLLRRIE